MSLEALEEEMRIFVQTESCPNLVREDFELSQKETEVNEDENDFGRHITHLFSFFKSLSVSPYRIPIQKGIDRSWIKIKLNKLS